MNPEEIDRLTLPYKGKQVSLSKLFSLGLAGDTSAKGKLLDRENNNITKLAVKSMTEMWDFAQDINAMKDEAKNKTEKKQSKQPPKQEDPFNDKKVDTDQPIEQLLDV